METKRMDEKDLSRTTHNKMKEENYQLNYQMKSLQDEITFIKESFN
jgi:hypothetical protein